MPSFFEAGEGVELGAFIEVRVFKELVPSLVKPFIIFS
jgi:hypothetical protein